MKKCWCGETNLKNWNNDYLYCPSCVTLISIPDPENSIYLETDEDQDLPNYYQEKMFTVYREANACNDVYDVILFHYRERVAYWVNTFLEYKLPPGKTLEVGCGLGTLVHALQALGFEASGLEISEKLCATMGKILDINISAQDLMSLGAEHNNSYDAIFLMDIIEHIEDPISLLNKVSSLLKNDGILFAQLPCYKAESYAEMSENNKVFLPQLLVGEHLYLYSPNSIQSLLANCGFKHLIYHQALFPSDMFFVAGKEEIQNLPQGAAKKYFFTKPESIAIYANFYNYKK